MWEAGGGRRGGGEGEGGRERATDSMEPQNSHKQSLLSGLVRHFHIIRKSVDMLPLVQTPNQFEFCDFPCEGERHFGTEHREAWLVIFD